MRLTDTRRLTGPSLLLDVPGAIVEAAVADDQAEALVAAWERELGALWRETVGGRPATAHRVYRGGVSLAVGAPTDALYAATEINEAAFGRAVAAMGGDAEAAMGGVGEMRSVETLRQSLASESEPPLLDLEEAADAHGVTFLWDDDDASVGLGTGSRMWPVEDIPSPDELDWGAIHDVPTAIVTGTNGKSTTARMLAQIVRAAGRTVGLTSTDGVTVDGRTIAHGDYSGPGGARTALRERAVEVGVLEVARGGILRRGLGLPRATAAAVTNVDEDHLGDYGIETVEQLAGVKFVVAKALGDGGALVTNHDDAHCRREAARLAPELARRGARVVWTGLAPEALPDGPAASVVDGHVARRGAAGGWARVVAVDAVPAARGGAARYNVRNALTAAALAHALGLPDAAVADGLRRFVSDADTNPGRGNVFDVGGATVWVDFAHNAHALAALTETVAALPAARRLVMLSHAGDRTDREIRAVAEAVAGLGAARYVVAELPDYRRGRAPGEVPALLRGALLASGVAPGAIADAADPADGTRAALAWAGPGDVLLLLVLSRRDDAMAAIREAGGVPA